MRVLLVTDFYHPYIGGVELHVRTLARALADRGHEVAVATLPVADGQERTADGPVTVYTVGHLAQRIGARFAHVERPWAPPFPDPVTTVGLRRVVRDFRPDVIHGHDWLARSALPRAVSGTVPVITSLHYYTRNCAKKTLWRDGTVCEGPAFRRCLSCAADHYGTARGVAVTLGVRAGQWFEDRRTSRWISVSAATEAGNGLVGAPHSSVIVNPVPSNPDRVAGPTDEAASSAPLPEAVPDGPFILFVGDIRPEKGVAVLADAVTMLRGRGVDVPLVLAGETMSGDVTFPSGTVQLGPVPNPVVKRLWATATVGVVPSLWPEPFGLVAIEAIEGGCPLVAADHGGLAEILADGRGTLVPPGDAARLADGVAALLADEDARATQARLATASLDRYRVDVVVDQIEAEYRQALGPVPSGSAVAGVGR
ncbi:MAG: glycosyltransferase family 4 protein [Actinomycetota bacterium]